MLLHLSLFYCVVIFNINKYVRFRQKPVLKLMFGALIGAAERWRGLRFTEFELRQLAAVRKELDEEYGASINSPARSSSPVFPASPRLDRLTAARRRISNKGLLSCGWDRVRLVSSMFPFTKMSRAGRIHIQYFHNCIVVRMKPHRDLQCDDDNSS
jgi:hypothetical protein